MDAVTLGSCGHSVCKKCVLRDLTSACKKCGTAYEPFNTDPMDEESNIKLSILVCELTDKYWEKEKQAVQLRNEGNKLFQRGDVEASLVKYSEAFQMSKEDHLITSNRSHAYFKAGKLKEALEDAERTIALKPDWGKGYFRRGMALASLGNMEEALISYFQCLVLEESCSKALRTEIYKVQQFSPIQEMKISKFNPYQKMYKCSTLFLSKMYNLSPYVTTNLNCPRISHHI